jgi:hypothetical protein
MRAAGSPQQRRSALLATVRLVREGYNNKRETPS